jgi:elongation factor Ts
LASASKKASREANDGIVKATVSEDGKIGAMVELNCETDFVARTEDFQTFADALLRQVVEQPVDNAESLLEAPFIDNPDLTVAQHLTETIAKLGENMKVRQAARFVLEDEGIIDSYIHIGGRVGVLVELTGSSSDVVADLAHDLALQVAAASPQFVTEDQVPAEQIEAEKSIYLAQIAEDKKPDNIKERIVEGKLKKWYGEITLMNQQFVKDNDLTITKLVQQKSKEAGSPLTVKRFARFELGVN